MTYSELLQQPEVQDAITILHNVNDFIMLFTALSIALLVILAIVLIFKYFLPMF